MAENSKITEAIARVDDVRDRVKFSPPRMRVVVDDAITAGVLLGLCMANTAVDDDKAKKAIAVVEAALVDPYIKSLIQKAIVRTENSAEVSRG